jgi:SRSO17 transposase
LIGPGERKSIQPMPERFAAGDYDQLHHFMRDLGRDTGADRVAQ